MICLPLGFINDFFSMYRTFICSHNYYLVFQLFADLKVSSKFEDFLKGVQGRSFGAIFFTQVKKVFFYEIKKKLLPYLFSRKDLRDLIIKDINFIRIKSEHQK